MLELSLIFSDIIAFLVSLVFPLKASIDSDLKEIMEPSLWISLLASIIGTTIAFINHIHILSYIPSTPSEIPSLLIMVTAMPVSLLLYLLLYWLIDLLTGLIITITTLILRTIKQALTGPNPL